jgi:hypothetical protein
MMSNNVTNNTRCLLSAQYIEQTQYSLVRIDWLRNEFEYFMELREGFHRATQQKRDREEQRLPPAQGILVASYEHMQSGSKL